MKRRVVVTGMGTISPLGNDLASTWDGIVAGRSGVGLLTRFDASELPTRIGAEVKGFDASKYIEPKEVKKMDLFIHYAVAAALEAVRDSGLTIDDSNRDRIGVFIGAGMGGLPAIEETYRKIMEAGVRRVSPFFIPMTIINLASGQVAIRTGARGPNQSAVTACASGAHSIGDAFKSIQRGDTDAMIAGGTEAAICVLGVAGFCASKALSTRNDDPETASRPFDADRDGFVMGEGAGIVVLEELEQAKARGAHIHAEVVGYGSSGDAYHITAPPPDANGAVRCMRMALNDARMNPDEVGYVNAHATSTMADALETIAVKTTFGDHARKLVMGSTKSMTGHLLGAAGGVEAIFSVKALETGIIPPTINVHHQDPACDLDCNPGGAREARLGAVMSNSFGFGGTNASLVLRAYNG
ncbi:MAG: beta-ketoacyl-ACP synthase II [Nitrospirae bacterium]|nr:beta-ketoacyl-ACP synthase II [Nitrospirota bacterium]